MKRPYLEPGEPTATDMRAKSPYLLPQQAADFLHVKVSTLATWRWSGGGPAFHRWGRKVFYTALDLEAWAKAQRHDGPEKTA